MGQIHDGNVLDDASSGQSGQQQFFFKLNEKYYKVDILELPYTELNSSEGMHQLSNAIAMTEAAILVYDIAEHSSLTYLKAMSRTFYYALHHTETVGTKRKTAFPFSMSRRTMATLSVSNRPYNFLLLGTKNDIPDNLRDVLWHEGHKAASEFYGPEGVANGASAHFLECSSRTGDNIDSIFPLLGEAILSSRRDQWERQQVSMQEQEKKEAEAAQQRQSQNWRQRGGGLKIGAFDDDDDDWGCRDDVDYDIFDDDKDDDTTDDKDDYDECLTDDTNDDEASAGGTSAALVGSMRKRLGAIKATFTTSLFSKKDVK